LLACKALEESKKALDEADFRAKDLAGMVQTSANEVCEKLAQK
jgi:hypothetical protein